MLCDSSSLAFEGSQARFEYLEEPPAWKHPATYDSYRAACGLTQLSHPVRYCHATGCGRRKGWWNARAIGFCHSGPFWTRTCHSLPFGLLTALHSLTIPLPAHASGSSARRFARCTPRDAALLVELRAPENLFLRTAATTHASPM